MFVLIKIELSIRSFFRVKKCLLFILFWLNSFVSAQDIHFSQFNFSPLNQSPANTNLFKGDYRFVGNYKNQWQSVPVPYNTFSFSTDMNFLTLKNEDKIGGGLVFFYDKAGDSRFTSYSLMYSMSYILNFGKKLQSHSLSFGYQIGFVNRGFSYQKLFFDEQYNGDYYNASLPTGETYGRTNYFFLDMAAGVAYNWHKNMRNNFTIGFAIAHPNQPKQTFYADKTIRLNMKYNAHLRAQFKIARKCDLVTEFMFQLQDTKWEVIPGLHFKSYIYSKANTRVALNTGFYARPTDAIWGLIGLDYNDFQLNFTYDVNTSTLKPASRYNGGFEVSAIYIMSKLKKIQDRDAICPIF